MARYYVNNQPQQPSGDHEVHREDCHLLPADRKYLGEYATCAPAASALPPLNPLPDQCNRSQPTKGTADPR